MACLCVPLRHGAPRDRGPKAPAPTAACSPGRSVYNQGLRMRSLLQHAPFTWPRARVPPRREAVDRLRQRTALVDREMMTRTGVDAGALRGPDGADEAVGGKGDGNRGAVAELALELEPAAMELHEPAREGQAEAGALVAAAQAAVHLAEALERLRDILGGDADAGIGHGDGDAALVKEDRGRHAPLGRGEFHRIRQQVEQHLMDAA